MYLQVARSSNPYGKRKSKQDAGGTENINLAFDFNNTINLGKHRKLPYHHANDRIRRIKVIIIVSIINMLQ